MIKQAPISTAKKKIIGFNTETFCGITHYHQTFLVQTVSDTIDCIFKESINISKVMKIMITPVYGSQSIIC